MFQLGVVGAAPRELSWVLAMDLAAAGVQVGSVAGSIRQACEPALWLSVDAWLFWPHQLSGQCWRDLQSSCLARDVPLVAACRDAATARTALDNGVRCVVLASDSAWSLKAAVVAAVEGEPFLSPAVLAPTFSCVVRTLTAPAPAPAAPTQGLTDRELEVLRLLASGTTNAGIGEQLHIRPATVGTHVISILRKLGVSNRTQAAAAAHRMGLASSSASAPAPASVPSRRRTA